MRRAIVLGGILMVGALSMSVAALQQAAEKKAAAPMVIEVDKVKDNLFVLKGGGGNTAVFVTANGVVVVDAKNPGWGQPILDKIKELTPKPVTTLINTHTHGDHVSGNVAFPATVEVIVQENTKTHMDTMPIFASNQGRGLPKRTYKDKLTVGSGADQVDLYYWGPGHTDGDTWVVFTALRTAHLGDLFPSKSMPLIDGANGGSTLHYADTLNKGHAGIRNVDTVINGHNATTMVWADVKQYADFMADFRTFAQAQLAAGKTPEQAAAEWKIPEKYTGYNANVSAMMGGLVGRIQRLADEMKR
jgi:cyclase